MAEVHGQGGVQGGKDGDEGVDLVEVSPAGLDGELAESGFEPLLTRELAMGLPPLRPLGDGSLALGGWGACPVDTVVARGGAVELLSEPCTKRGRGLGQMLDQ